MQPWNFVVIQGAGKKARNEKAAANCSGPRGMLYRSLKLEGIEEAPVNLCVTADRTRPGPHVLERNTIVDSDLHSTCCAIENLWLAARVEGIGVGGGRRWAHRVPLDQLVYRERWGQSTS